MATHYPIVFEQEESGVYSAYVAGLPVYAQGATRSQAATAIVRTLGAYLRLIRRSSRARRCESPKSQFLPAVRLVRGSIW